MNLWESGNNINGVLNKKTKQNTDFILNGVSWKQDLSYFQQCFLFRWECVYNYRVMFCSVSSVPPNNISLWIPMKVQFACQYLHIIHFLDWFIINPSRARPLVIPVWRLSLDWFFSVTMSLQNVILCHQGSQL